ncbi:MAG: thiamine pyrophosphate-binding protein [Acidothermaceae bacterium]
METHPNMRLIQARDEAAAVFMAAGSSRATGSPALATVTAGPGLAHTLTPLVSACRANLPLVVYAGDTPRSGRYVGGLHEFDHRAFAELAGAMHLRVEDPQQAASCASDAVRLAVTHQRPVVLSVPEDLMETPSAPRTGELAPHHLPARAGEPPSTAPQSIRSQADVDVAEEIFAALSSVQTPMLVAGSGAVAVLPHMRALARSFGATLATTFRAKGYFDADAGNLGIIGPLAYSLHQCVQEQADLVVGIGANLHGFGAFVDSLIGCRTICLGTERYGGAPTSHPCGRDASISIVMELLREKAIGAGRANDRPIEVSIADRQQAIAADFAELPELFHDELASTGEDRTSALGLADAYRASADAGPVRVIDVRVSTEITSRWYRRLYLAGERQ